MNVSANLFMFPALALFSAIAGAQIASARELMIDIEAQPLIGALNGWAQQTGLQLIVPDELKADQLAAQAIKGSFTPQAALAHLLAGTPLTYVVVNERTVAIRSQDKRPVGLNKGEGELKPLRLAMVADVETEKARSTENPGRGGRAGVEEVIVTAQKRDERLRDVPVPVTAVRAAALVDSNQVRIQDYYTKVPGLSVTMLGDTAAPVLTIRGVTTGGYTNPTVGVVVDDLAFGTSTVTGGGHLAPDFDPSELARIEVLRGPQGTLYGASSLGGLLKYITIDPSTERTSGSLQMGSTKVRNGDGVGYNVRGAINLPLGDTLAMRASAFTRAEPGYIDDPVRGEEGVNSREVKGGRLSALWRPSDVLSIKVSALLQDSQRDGEDTVHRLPGLTGFQQTALRDTGWYDAKLQAYSATIMADAGSAEITSLSGYSVNEFSSALDMTPVFGGTTQGQFGVRGTENVIDWKTEKLTQELRLSMPIGERFDWLLGAFYTNEDYPQDTDILAIDPTTGAIAGSWYDGTTSASFTELAAFTDLTIHITERFDVQIGGRLSEIELATGQGVSTGPWNTVLLRNPSQTVVTREFESNDGSFTYLLTPRLKISPDLMLYARMASGYRPGGPNLAPLASNLGLPSEYSPDKTQNYEIGMKGDVLNHSLSFDGSIYYIDWKDIQIQLRDQATTALYYINASRAKSQGVELSIETRPLDGLTISAWSAWNNAELTEPFPLGSTVSGLRGDRLPYSAEWSGSLSIDQEFPLSSGSTGFLGLSGSYVGDRKGRFFAQSTQRESFPAYTQIDLRAGAKFDTWSINAFVNNVADKRGVLRGGRDASLSLIYAFNYIQPRTAGLSLTKSF